LWSRTEPCLWGRLPSWSWNTLGPAYLRYRSTHFLKAAAWPCLSTPRASKPRKPLLPSSWKDFRPRKPEPSWPRVMKTNCGPSWPEPWAENMALGHSKETDMALLDSSTIRLGARYQDKTEAIRDVGRILFEAGIIGAEYIDKMVEREALATTYVGNGVAVPHGTKDSIVFVKKTGLAVVQVPDGVDFGNGNRARLLVGIAAKGNEHLDLLTAIASVCADDERLERLIAARDAKAVLEELAAEGV